ncbi:imidazoleglycerol-phosphate dehydratase [Bacillus sanguinis]
MTNQNGSKGSGNQGSPKSGQFQQEFSTEFETGNDNKGKEYRSKKGSKSKKGVNHFTPFLI